MNGAPWSLNNASFAWLVSFLSERGVNHAGAHGVGVVSPAPNLTERTPSPSNRRGLSALGTAGRF